MSPIATSNHQKYVEGRKNPIVSALMDRLTGAVAHRIRQFQPNNLLDAGCGEGHALHSLIPETVGTYAGIDANPECIAWCQAQFPERQFAVGSVMALPFGDRSFDVVLCMEVLEHLQQPELAVRELARVTRNGVVLSVPFEPIFQAGNLARGKYLPTWGNHPEHCQHWGRRSFPRWLKATGCLTDIQVEVAGSWLVASGRPTA